MSEPTCKRDHAGKHYWQLDSVWPGGGGVVHECQRCGLTCHTTYGRGSKPTEVIYKESKT